MCVRVRACDCLGLCVCVCRVCCPSVCPSVFDLCLTFSQKPVKRKSKKNDNDGDTSDSTAHVKKPRKAMTAEEWLVDATVNLKPEDVVVCVLCVIRILTLTGRTTRT
jgi:hypothetical protein